MDELSALAPLALAALAGILVLCLLWRAQRVIFRRRVPRLLAAGAVLWIVVLDTVAFLTGAFEDIEPPVIWGWHFLPPLVVSLAVGLFSWVQRAR